MANVTELLGGASSLLQGLDVIPQAQSSAPPASQAAGYTNPAATTLTGGAAPSSAPTAHVPTWAWVAGGVGVLLLVVLVARR